MEKLNLPDLSETEALSFLFYQVPQVLVDDETFSGLDGWAIILYSLMLNRSGLSVKNRENFTDENGRLYIIFTIDEVMKRCRCGKNVAIKLMKQLEDIGLIEKKLQGLGKPALVYVKNFAYYAFDNSQKFKKQTSEVYKINSRSLKNKPDDVYKINPNHINQENHIYSSNINSIRSEMPVDNSHQTPEAPLDDVRFSDKSKENLTNHNLNIEYLISKYPEKKHLLSEIDNLISKTFKGGEQQFRIGRKNVEAYNVRYALRSIDNRHIEYVLHSLDKKDLSSIKSYENYLLTSLYNSTNHVFIDVDAVKNAVKQNINLDYLLNKYPYKQKELTEIFNIIVETLITQKKSFRIARGELPAELIKQAFVNLSDEHVEFVFDALQKNTSEIKSVKSYIQTSLYNSTNSINNHISLDVQRFLYEHLGIERN